MSSVRAHASIQTLTSPRLTMTTDTPEKSYQCEVPPARWSLKFLGAWRAPHGPMLPKCCQNADINDEPPALHIFPDMRSKANKKQ